MKELDQRFSFIMIHYIDYYIKNGLSYDNNNEYYQEYMRLITNLEKLDCNFYFVYGSDNPKLYQDFLKDINLKKETLDKQIDIEILTV